MTANPKAVQAKEDGNNAWSVGSYDLAIEHFTTAIAFGGDLEFRKTVYSNRSAAYLKLKKYQESLSDATKCVDLDPTWGKGYARKGEALMALKRYTDAYITFNAGLKANPNDPTLTKKCEQASKYLKNAVQEQQKAESTLLTGVVLLYKVATIILCLLYFLPLGQLSFYSYKGASVLLAGVSLFLMYSAHGMPAMTNEYAVKVIADSNTTKAFLGVALFISNPYFLPVLAVIALELTAFTSMVVQHLPKVQEKVQPIVSRLVPSMASKVEMIGSLTEVNINSTLHLIAANCEVIQGFYLIVALLLPSRSLVQIYLWWQYLRIRYKMDTTGSVKKAFAALDQHLTSAVNHKACPAAGKRGYEYVKGMLVKQVEVPKEKPTPEKESTTAAE